MTVDFVLRFNDFKGGDHGLRDPAYANADTFSGENMVLYPSGLLGPRAGLKEVAARGIPDHTIVPGPMGFAVAGNRLLVVMGNRVYSVEATGGPATAWAPYPHPIVTPVRFIQGNRYVYSLVDGDLFKHDSDVSTTAISTPVPFSDICRWTYWFVAVDRNVPWRIWFSKVSSAGSNFDLWPDNNYLDVGNNDPITCLQPIYNTLYVGKREGWWAVSGVLGQLASQRDVTVGNGPIDCRSTNLTTDNRIVYWPLNNTPAFFNGERVTLESDQEMDRRFLPYTGDSVIVTPTARRIVLAGDDLPAGNPRGDTRLWAYQDGIWTHHRTPFRLGALAPGDARTGADLPNNVVYAAQRALTVGDPTVIVSITHDLNRPAHHSDPYASPNDGPNADELMTGSVSLPAWYDGQGRQVRVRWLQVQFRKWASGIANTMNRLTIRVEALGGYGTGSEHSDPVHWIEPSDRAGRDGDDDSYRANLGEQGWANGFRIHFDEVAGVAIREVIIGVNLRTERQ